MPCRGGTAASAGPGSEGASGQTPTSTTARDAAGALPAYVSQWPADAAEALEERVSIMVADRVPDAPRRAEERVRLEWARRRTGFAQEGRSRAGEGEGMAWSARG